MRPTTRSLLLRLLALLLVVAAVPGVIALGALSEDTAVVVGQPSPRTIRAERLVEVRDDDATAAERDRAEALVQPVTRDDLDAVDQWLSSTRGVFAAASAVREPASADEDGSGGTVPSPATQEAELRSALPEVDGEPVLEAAGVSLLVSIDDTNLESLRSATLDVTEELARRDIEDGQVAQVLDAELPRSLRVQGLSDEEEELVVEPLVRGLARPTVSVDAQETARQRQQARDEVEPVVAVFAQDEIVVPAGETVDELEFTAIEQLGLVGSRPGVALFRALVAMVAVAAVAATFLRRIEPSLWEDGVRVLVLASLVVLGALVLVVAAILAREFDPAWWFAVPVGGIVLLATVLVGPVGGVVTSLPLVVMSLVVAPQVPGLGLYTVAMAIMATPLAQGVATRSGLRKATVRMVVASPLVAAAAGLVLGPGLSFLLVAGAGAVGGLAGFGLVQSLLPGYENLFRLATVTSLLDLADRNHPLLRELEQKALGSYNHSVMVASLTERACRTIGANDLLGQVAALYHDIGKVRQPHFFIENQRGIANPHDELEPRVSAVIIHNHVKDGVEMATEHRLPPDVVDCIGSHHGTMLVTYFYRQAVADAGGDDAQVDEDHFRYKGHKPRSKEAAVLLLADCSEATTRAMAMNRGTLPSDEIADTVDGLLRDRLEDGQFDECELTFVELRQVRDAIVEALTGIYHPRIAYPSAKREQQGAAGGS